MRTLIVISLALLIVACKSNKEVVRNQVLVSDSIARIKHHRTIATIDSMMRNIDFSFDTLNINIEKPSLVADKPEVIRLTAVKGRVIDRQRVQRNQVEDFNRLDTVAYHHTAAESSTEHAATTRLYNPPDGTLLGIIAIMVLGVLLYIFLRKK